MDRPSTPDTSRTSPEPADVTTTSTADPQSVSPTTSNKPLPKRLAALPGAAEHFPMNGEKMMHGYKRTRGPNKKKKNKPAESSQESSQTALGRNVVSLSPMAQQKDITDPVDDTHGTISLYPVTYGAQQYSHYNEGAYPDMPGSIYPQPSSPPFTTSQGISLNPLEDQYPMGSAIVGIHPQRVIHPQAPGTMQQATPYRPEGQFPFSFPPGADMIGLPSSSSDPFYAQGSSAVFGQYSVSPFHGADYGPRHNPSVLGSFQHEWIAQPDDNGETPALPQQPSPRNRGDGQYDRR